MLDNLLPHNILKESVPVVFRQVLTNVVLQAVRLHFISFNTDTCCDKVSVYDGNDATAPLLHTFSGTSRPSDVSSSGSTVFVSFVTDLSGTGNGFNITYSTNTHVPGTL